MRESIIEAYGKKRAEAAGGVIRKLKWIGRNSAPDRVLMIPRKEGLQESAILPGVMIWSCLDQGELVWVEFKATGKKPTGAQVREHNRMRAVGQTVLVWDSIEAIDKWFEGRR